MRKLKLIAGLVLVLVVVITLGSFTAYRFVKRAFGNVPSAPRSAQSTPSSKQAEPAAITSPPVVLRGEIMAQAFRSGRLPAPLPQPEGPPEQAAAELARRVIAEDEQSTAALLTALQMSGFSVRADDGSVALKSVDPGQGIVIDAWEVAALAKLFSGGMQVSLTDFSNSFSSTLPAFKKAQMAGLFLKGLRSAAQGNQPALRFWADFIAELGRQSESPYDLLAPDVDTAKINLDAIQVSLILRRLVADLIIQYESNNQKANWPPSEDRWISPRWRPASYNLKLGARPNFLNAVWHPDRGPSLVLVQEGGGGSNLPCTLKEVESQILDVTAYGYTKAFDSLLEYLAESAEMEGARKYSNATAAINAILAVIKLIAYYACMETDITMNGGPPLVRTQNIYQPGERRTLTATVRENIGKWQALNCTRIALNGMNLDISLPNDGPVAGVKTQWVLTSGGDEINHGDITYRIVEFVSPDGTPHIQDTTGDISNSSAPKTDEEGHTTIDIEGVKQKEKLSSPIPVMKQAAVRFTVAAKPVTMRQDLIDAAGLGIAGGVALGVGAPVEMLLRSNIYFSKELKIPVKDWDSCDGGWGGSISYASTFGFVRNDAVHRITDAKNETIHDNVHLRGNPNSGKGWAGSSQGNFTASYGMKYRTTATWLPASRPGFSFGGATITTEENASAGGGGDASVAISPQGDNKYMIGATSFAITGVDLWHTTCAGDCKGKNMPDKNNPLNYGLTYPAVKAEEDPNHPGELHGSTTLENTPMMGATTTVEWNLKQCQGR